MKRRSDVLRRILAGAVGTAVMFAALLQGAVGETPAAKTNDMTAMMEQYQQMMGGSSSSDMSAMMEQYQQMMGGGSGDMTAMLQQYMGGSIDEETAAMISQYVGVDISALLGLGEEKEPIQWVKVEIRDYDDWKEFAENCRLDTWSQDKEVHLKTDLELKDNEIIPTFGGIFDGEGHTVSGLDLAESGSYRGLFRYVQKGAEVKDLNVSGSVRISGSWEAVGGIVGENSGTVARCTFEGTVEGSNAVGGIAGVNSLTGQIVGCSVSGEVLGEHGTGGIAGKNSGSLIRCISTADVNTDAESVTPELDELKAEDIAASENFTACTDTGGIAGYSAGFIQHCISRGTIGYPHTGYNVGGIAGRQNGYIVNCTNHGTVLGRKEVGGIVGQMEPYFQLNMDAESLMGMSSSFTDLQSRLDGMLAGLGGGNSGISSHMTELNKLTGEAKGSIEGLLGGIMDLGEEAVDTVNDLSLRISRVTEMSVPMIGDIEETFDSFEDVFLLLEEAIAEMEDAADPAEDVMDEIYDAMDDLSDAFDDVEDAASALKMALNNLLSALGTTDETKAALAQAEIALRALAVTLKDTASAVGALAEGFAKLEEDQLPLDKEVLAEELAAVEEAVRISGEAADRLNEGLRAVMNELMAEAEPDMKKLQAGWEHIVDAIGLMSSAGEEMAGAFDHIRETIPPVEEIGEELLDSSEIFREMLEAIAEATSFTSDAVGELENIFADQAKEPALQLPKLKEQFRADSEDLSKTMDAMLAEMQELQLTASNMTGNLINSLRELVGSFDDIIASVMSSTSGSGSGDIIEDVSEEESSGILGISMGTVDSCTNLGSVDGDTNTGGLAGSMAVEVSIDPDLELQLDSMPLMSLKLQTRAVLRSGVNKGSVSSRKDCTGGIVGKAGLGLVTGCTAVCDISSTGSYVGGIAGQADTPVRECWAKGLLSGASYVGGIAGSASELTDCRAQAQMKSIVAYCGAVAGEAETLSGNLFVSGELGGVDGISYAGKAEPIDMADFLKLSGVPKELRTMTVSFVFEDGTVTSVSVEPGGQLDEDDIPELPVKEGYAAYWDGLADLDTVDSDTVIRAAYTLGTNTVQSAQTSSDGRPVLLFQGGFDSAAEVELTASETCPELTEKETFIEGWSFHVPAGSSVKVRYLLPKKVDQKDIRLAVRNGGEWTDAEFTVDGSYAVFDVGNGANELACIESPKPIWPWLAVGGGGLAAAAAVIVVFARKGRRSHKI